LNSFAERFVRSAKEECMDRMIFFSEAALWRATQEFLAHYLRERNHQGLEIGCLFFMTNRKTQDQSNAINASLAASGATPARAYPLWDGSESVADYAKKVNLRPRKRSISATALRWNWC